MVDLKDKQLLEILAKSQLTDGAYFDSIE